METKDRLGRSTMFKRASLYISISRWFSLDIGKKSDVELHIYSDASNSADGAVAATNIFWSR